VSFDARSIALTAHPHEPDISVLRKACELSNIHSLPIRQQPGSAAKRLRVPQGV